MGVLIILKIAMQKINNDLPAFTPPLRDEDAQSKTNKIVQTFKTIIHDENELFLYLNKEDQKKYSAYKAQGCSAKWSLNHKTKLVASKVIRKCIVGRSLESIVYLLRNTSHAEEFLHFLHVKPEILEEIQSIPNQFTTDIWKRYAVRTPNFNRFYNRADQMVYGNMMHRSVAIAANLIKKKQFSISEIREFLASRRRDIAFFQLCNTLCTQKNIEKAAKYGLTRSEDAGVTTKLPENGSYYKIVEESWRYVRKCKKEKKDDLLETEIDEDNEKPNGYVTFYTRLKGQKVKLHSMDFDFSIQRTDLTDEQIDEMNDRLHCPLFFHTQSLHNPDYDKMLKHLDSLFEEAFEEMNPSMLLKTLAKIFFWSCHVKPYYFGEPSIAETEFRSIWESKEFTCLKSLPPWKEGIIPWSEVVIRFSEEDFVEAFPSLFDWSHYSFESNSNLYDLFELEKIADFVNQ